MGKPSCEGFLYLAGRPKKRKERKRNQRNTQMAQTYSYNYPWNKLPFELYPRVAREYLDHGVDTFVLIFELVLDMMNSPERLEGMRKLTREMGVRFVSVHAPCGRPYDINIPEVEQREVMIQTHIRCMEIAAEFGSQTYTVHVGASHYCRDHYPLAPLRENAHRVLERLLPEAERIGIIIAVENSFEPPNSPKEVLGIITPFLSSKYIGVCYDTGHANIMAPASWKKAELYAPYMARSWWEGFVEEPNPLEIVKEHVVTTHIHDNSGYGDLHAMPFDGTIDWDALMPQLHACPRMLEFQTEICFDDGNNWAGHLMAPIGGYSINRQVEVYRKLGFK